MDAVTDCDAGTDPVDERVAKTLLVTDLVSGALFVMDLVDEAVPVVERVALALVEEDGEGVCEEDDVCDGLGIAEGLLELLIDTDAELLDEGVLDGVCVLEGVTSAYTCTARRQA